MELSEEQKQSVSEWVKEGCGLSEIQQRLSDKFGMSMTYMDVRFLVIDLGLDVKDREVSRVAEPEETPPVPLPAEEDVPAAVAPPADAALSGVSIELDRLMKPGFLVSGTVTFSDGETATWGLDQLGRLALDPAQTGYKPSDTDVAAFQNELRSALESRGF